jgi:hypothetical protein
MTMDTQDIIGFCFYIAASAMLFLAIRDYFIGDYQASMAAALLCYILFKCARRTLKE